MRIFRACREIGIETVAVYSDADQRFASTSRYADEAVTDRARRLRASRTSPSTGILDAAKRTGARPDPPRLRIPRRERGLRPGVPRRGPDVRRPGARGDRGDGLEDRDRQPHDRRRAVPVVPGMSRGRGTPTTSIAVRARGRLSDPAQGVRRAAAEGDARRRRGGRACAPPSQRAASEARAFFGDGGGVRREARRRRRGTSEVRSSATPQGRCAPCGERECSHPAAPPEGRRGVSVARRRSRRCGLRLGDAALAAARAVGYVSCGTVEFLLDRDRQLLFPRDEHAAAGRAPGHGGGLGRRPRGDDDLGSRRGEPLSVRRGETSRPQGTRSSAGSTPRIRERNFAPSPGTDRVPARFRRDRGPPRRRRGKRVGRADRLRPDARKADRERAQPGRSDRAPGPGAGECEVVGIRTSLPFSGIS